MQNFHNESILRLYDVISKIDDPELCADFFEDICTIKEIQDMAQRLDTAILLKEGNNYQQISQKVGVSNGTISRVNRCLEYGTGGYNKVLEMMEKDK